MPHFVNHQNGFIDLKFDALFLCEFRYVQKFLHLRKDVKRFSLFNVPLVSEFSDDSLVLISRQLFWIQEVIDTARRLQDCTHINSYSFSGVKERDGSYFVVLGTLSSAAELLRAARRNRDL